LTLSLLTQPRDRIYEAVRDAEVNCAFVLSDREPSGFSVITLRDEPLYFVASPKYFLAQRRRIADMREARFIMGPKNSAYTAMVDGILERSRISSYSIAMRISNFEGIKEAVRAGAGICLLPRCAVRRELLEKSLVKVHVQTLDLKAKIMLIERQKSSTTPTVEAVKKFLIAGINTM
jgi:DNA-binding transcriptional LysR family regulator